MLARDKRSTFRGHQSKFLLQYIYLILILCAFMFSGAFAQPENKSAWVWSVKAGDINGLDPNHTPEFYMPNDEVRISWNITPSADVTFKDAELRIYPSDADRSKYIISYLIKPPYNVGNKYFPLNGSTSLIKFLTKNERTYNVEINANAQTSSKLVNETHIIEIKIKEPGTLEIRKSVPAWRDANLSGWVFWVEGPKEPPEQSTNRSTISDNLGIAIVPNLRPGTYKITETVKDGWATRLSPREVEIKPGEALSQEFENIPNTIKICTRTYPENNTLRNWGYLITPLDKPSGTIQTPLSDDSGCTKCTGLPSGRCKVEVKLQVGWKLKNDIPEVIFDNGQDKSLLVIVAETGTLKILKKDSEGQPIKGITFSISGPDRDLTSPTVPTDDAGVITVSDLLPGEYTINEIIPANLQGRWRPKTEISQRVTLDPGGIATVQYINEQLLTLRIMKFDDNTKKGLPGWMFTVEGPEGVKRVGPTNSQGIIDVDDLIPGKYIVTEEISQDSQPGWVCTTQNPKPVQISSKLPNEVRFGNKVNRLIITKFNDKNLNGKLDDVEEGLKGWNFTLNGPNSLTITSEPTNVSGITILEGLMPGDYLITEVLQGGWINTTLRNRSISIKAGVEQKVDFGNIKSNVIEIFNFNDTNRNGIIDSGEGGLPGWIFTIKGSNGYVVTTKPTNADGITIVEGLFPGNYTVTEDLLEGWLSTTSPAMNVSLGFGDRQKLTFGNYYCVSCHRITDNRKTDNNSDQELIVTKEVSNISAEKIDKDNGYVVNYNITICPSRGLKNIGAIPTDIVIAVDNSPSINNLNRSTIAGVQKLVDGIKAHDKLNVTRVGLVSWSDENKTNSKIMMPLTSDYRGIISTASQIKFAEGTQTNYPVGLDTALDAFKTAGIISGRDKKIVLITDAIDNGSVEPNILDVRYSDYAIFAIVVGDQKGSNTSKMLDALTSEHNGYVVSVNDLSELGGVLIKMATAGSRMKNVHLVEVLPNYLVLLNGTATEDKGKVRLNGDSKDWTTTTIAWDIGDLSDCWSTNFQAVFCWKLPADVNQPRQVSFVNYTNEKGVSKTIELPEHEINIVSTLSQKPQEVSANTEEKKQPGFEMLFAAIGLCLAGYLCRRRC
jgi:hypothetical protein